MKRISILLVLSIVAGLLCTACNNAGEASTSSMLSQSSSLTDAPVSSEEVASAEESVSSEDAASVVSAATSQGAASVNATVSSQKDTVSNTGASVSSVGKTSSVANVNTSSTPQKEEDSMDKTMRAFFNVMPKVTEVSAYNPKSHASGANQWSNIKAITYDGATINGNKTKIFAYVGFPSNASATNKVPAVVLVHGGGGHAYAEWIKLWNDRGYAAIAMDNTGFFPSEAGKGLAGREGDNAAWWNYGLYGDFAQAGYVNAPNNDAMNSSGKPLDQQWMYHAVASTILAHNILLTDNRVNVGKIGITGVSWGAVITSLAIGYDNRYAFAIPIYGSGYLDESYSYFDTLFSPETTKELWSAADRFDKVKFPTLWLAYANDHAFSINTNSLSYEAVKATGGILSIKQNWSHSHNGAYIAQESYRFADSICKNGKDMVTCVTEPSGRNISFKIKTASDIQKVTATAYYITSQMSYNGQTLNQSWQSVPCTVNGDTVTGTLPAEAHSYYVELKAITSSGAYVTTTRFAENIR